jgi:cytidine deaminase
VISDTDRDKLVAIACEMRARAYAPYSRFTVGAALLGEDGQIYTGANVENASYGLSVCAERTAVFKAVTAGVMRIKAAAVCTENGVSPCGACRQVLAEFAGDIPIWLSDAQGQVRLLTLDQLLPYCFGRGDLIAGQDG